jgi:hypothetical protein
MLEQWGFVALTFALVFAAISYLPKGYPAAFAVAVVIFAVSYFGPPIFGQAWVFQGFWGGVVFGGFLEYAMISSKNDNADLPPHTLSESEAKVVLSLNYYDTKNSTTITIEDPGFIPLIGDRVSFVDRHGWEVVERRINYHGSSGARKCFVSVSLREK